MAGEDLRLRDLLRDAEPQGFSVRKAWVRWIQVLRSRRKHTGVADPLATRAALEQALDRKPFIDAAEATSNAAQIKSRLERIRREEMSAPENHRLAAQISELIVRTVPSTCLEPVAIDVWWPPDFPLQARPVLLGIEETRLADFPARDAGALVARLDGLSLAGGVLRVRPRLPPSLVLPSAGGGAPNLMNRRSAVGPWLEHLDEEGRFSLSPRRMAEAQAALMSAARVVDLFCGCGGNAIAFARRGKEVIAVEQDRNRLELARKNAHDHGVDERIRFVLGDGFALATELIDSETGVFADPPWGGPVGSNQACQWRDLFVGDAEFVSALAVAPVVMLKVPRSFEPASMPAGIGLDWSVRAEFGTPETGDAHVVKALTIWGDRTTGVC